MRISEFGIVAAIALASCFGVAQQKPAPEPATSNTQQQSGTVPRATVEAWLQRTYGFDPELKWQIVSIKPSEVPGISEVVYFIGAQPQATHLYVSSDGKHAIVGQVVPFGADPFADARQKLAASTTGFYEGATQPKTTIAVFSDLQCPHCKAAEPVLEQLKEQVPGVRLQFQEFPIASIHPWAMIAAKYSDCVAKLDGGDKAFAFNDAVFAAQEQITPENAEQQFKDVLTKQQLDPAKVSACVAEPATAQRIERSIELGKSLDVTGTPTVFVNGRRLPTVVDIPLDTLKQLVQYEEQQPK